MDNVAQLDFALKNNGDDDEKDEQAKNNANNILADKPNAVHNGCY